MKVAVVGTGSMGGFHAGALATMQAVDEVLVVDPDVARAADAARAAGGRAVGFDEALSLADAMIIATPPELHRAQVDAALDAGLHVLCEKPLADGLEASIALTRRCERESAHLEIGFQRRHDAGFLAARAAAGGRLHLVRLVAHDPLVERVPFGGTPPPIAPMFRDSSIHDFDFVRWLSGQEVVEVSVEAGRRDGSIAGDPREIERAIVTMRLSAGTLAVLEASWVHPAGYDIRIELVAERGAVTAGLGSRTPATHLDWPGAPTHAPWPGYLERFADAYRAELTAFLAACRGELPPTSTARDGLEAMRVAVAATRSHLERRRVAMDEIEGLLPVEVA